MVVAISKILRLFRRIGNTIRELLRANLLNYSSSASPSHANRWHLNHLSLLHVLQAFLHTGEAARLDKYRVGLDLARGKHLGQQICVPLSFQLLESHLMSKTRVGYNKSDVRG